MCGRYTLKASERGHRRGLLDLADVPQLPAPLQHRPLPTGPRRAARPGERPTGLAPSSGDSFLPGPKSTAIGNRLINARAETVAERPAFRTAFKKRRCLVPADGFYEWKRENGKTPYYFRLKDESPFAFAGLWERWEKGEEPVESCTLITCEANGVVAPVHNRMPVILDPKATPDGSTPRSSERGPRAVARPAPR